VSFVLCRIAFQKLEFANMMSSSTEMKPSGPSVLVSRCCLAAGYKVVPVSSPNNLHKCFMQFICHSSGRALQEILLNFCL